nr:glycoside hydrolase family 2 TIM barrel-domain containing protein [uncultured Draconibacterium sp.]
MRSTRNFSILKHVKILSLFALVWCFATVAVWAQNDSRLTRSINESWYFHKGEISLESKMDFNDTGWQPIAIPHTWNNVDATDDEPGYYRGEAWYGKTLFIPEQFAKQHTFLCFEGVNQVADVFLNGNWVGQHKGGYTRFNFDITPYISYSAKNQLMVKVSNAHDKHIPPLSADFTFFGGIYRDVYLLHVSDVHFACDDNASSGIYISTPSVSKELAEINIKSLISNQSSKQRHIKLENRILDHNGKIVVSKVKQQTLTKEETKQLVFESFNLESPELWAPDNPYLYRVHTKLEDADNGAVLDELIQPLGIRWFEFTADSGFFLNGQYLKLIGTNRHQDYLQKGNALVDEMHIRDIRLLKEMGGNFLRIAHYPQDEKVLEMCDKLGILASVEIPIVNAITEDHEFTENALQMTEEMVKQNFNHPALIIWAYMNEVLLRPPFKLDSKRGKEYLQNVIKLAEKIEQKIRDEDPSRYTMIPNHGAFERYVNSGLTSIPMVVGWNLYQGWYGGRFQDFEKYLEKHHQQLPDVPMIITEYGADVNPRLHTFHPERFDYTVEYGNMLHAHYLQAIMDRAYVAGATIWNLNDFYSEARGYALPHVNLKGITGLNREKKDTWWLYKALLSEKPIVAFGQKHWKIRGGVLNKKPYSCVQPVEVYSNAKEVELFHNGTSLGTNKITNYKTTFDVPFENGENKLEAVAQTVSGSIRDMNTVDFRLIGSNLKDLKLPFSEMNVMLGSKRYYENMKTAQVWIPEKEYTEGSWGYIGGQPYKAKTRFGALPCSELNILNTDDDPLYQNQRVGIKEFKLDVPEGKYELTLMWAELVSDVEHEKLAYNLGNDKINEETKERIFNVLINGKYVERNLNLTADYGAEKAISKKYKVVVTDNNGIDIRFEAVKGEPVLNAIRVYRSF